MTALPQIAADRTRGIGGSDAAAITGGVVDAFKTRLQVYLEKVGEAEPEPETPAMRWGKLLEDPVAAEYSAVTGRKLRRVNRTLRHRDHPFLVAHIDRDVVRDGGADRILEVKTANPFARDAWGEAGTDAIPEPYVLQVQHYLAVTGAEVCDVAALIGGSDFRIYEVQRDDELIAMLIDEEVRFWRDHVEPRKPPDPASSEECAKRWRTATERVVIVTPGLLQSIEALAEVRAQQSLLEAERDELERAIKMALGDAQAVVNERKQQLVTWKNTHTTSFDSKAFDEAHPGLREQFKARKPTRAFRLLKAAKKGVQQP